MFSADQERWAVCVTITTLLGIGGEYPYKHGNCFSVRTQDGDDLKIVNMYRENLEHQEIEWPIRVLKIGERTAVVHDERIPHEAYSSRFCEVCCPREMLPAPQLLRHSRDELAGRSLPTRTGTLVSSGGLIAAAGVEYVWTIPGIWRCR